jgi:hypothetical protein
MLLYYFRNKDYVVISKHLMTKSKVKSAFLVDATYKMCSGFNLLKLKSKFRVVFKALVETLIQGTPAQASIRCILLIVGSLAF